jgi:hypothetical protein
VAGSADDGVIPMINMTRFIETHEQGINRLISARGILLFALLMAYVGNLMIVTKKFSKGVKFLGSYWEVEGPQIFIAGILLTCVSLWLLWSAYFRRVLKLFPRLKKATYYFMIVTIICLSVPFLEKYINTMSPIIYLGSLPLILIYGYLFHKYVVHKVLSFDDYKGLLKPRTVICCKCLNPFSGDIYKESICPKCGGILENLEGFYKRHPELKT